MTRLASNNSGQSACAGSDPAQARKATSEIDVMTFIFKNPDRNGSSTETVENNIGLIDDVVSNLGRPTIRRRDLHAHGSLVRRVDDQADDLGKIANSLAVGMSCNDLLEVSALGSDDGAQ